MEASIQGVGCNFAYFKRIFKPLSTNLLVPPLSLLLLIPVSSPSLLFQSGTEDPPCAGTWVGWYMVHGIITITYPCLILQSALSRSFCRPSNCWFVVYPLTATIISPSNNMRDILGEVSMSGKVILLSDLHRKMVPQPSRSIITSTWGDSTSHPMNYAGIYYDSQHSAQYLPIEEWSPRTEFHLSGLKA